MNTPKRFTALELATTGFILVCCVQPATAGNKAQVAPNGFGKVESSLSYQTTLREAKMPLTGVALTNTAFAPAAGVFIKTPTGWPPSTTNKVVTASPTNCPATNFCTVTSQYYVGGYKATVRASVIGGAVADDADLELKIPITPAACAFYAAESDIVSNAPASGELQLRGDGSAGTAIWIRALLYTGPSLPDGQSPSRDDLIANGVLKGEIVLAGPFSYGEGCPLRLPINGDMSKIYMLVDTVAKSEPYTMTCPNPVSFGCLDGNPVYPDPAITGGCEIGAFADVNYSIAANALPIGVPTQVTATASVPDDPDSILATCTFTATRNVLVFDGFYPPIGVNNTGTDCSKVFKQSELTRRGQIIPIKFKTLCGGTSFSGGPPPTFRITSCTNAAFNVTGVCTFVSDEWHAQFDTGQIGVTVGTYIIEVTLQNGVKKQVAVKLK